MTTIDQEVVIEELDIIGEEDLEDERASEQDDAPAPALELITLAS